MELNDFFLKLKLGFSFLMRAPICCYSWLSNNQIHTIERGAFQDLVGLEKLRLNNNQIRHLPDLLFNNMMNLKRL